MTTISKCKSCGVAGLNVIFSHPSAVSYFFRREWANYTTQQQAKLKDWWSCTYTNTDEMKDDDDMIIIITIFIL